jgi:serine/threonine protein kinase
MIGEEIHGYRVDRAASEDKGGFGEVYFARHGTSGADAVLKVLKPEMSANREIVTRFFNEARAAASIRHPGIVAVHNVGYHRDRAYLLMERLSGEDLETRLARGAIPLEKALRFLRQSAGAIGAAHERGIVHRDLKPANLFVVPDPDVVGGERIKVLDFGIAKLGDGGASTLKTQGVFGTPAYMAPEQCESAAAVDARTDLYALGCILYEMICGKPPFGHGGLELIAAHLRDAPLPLRTRVPTVPPLAEGLAMSLLQKRRDDRPASCAALISKIDEIVAQLAVPPPASVSAPTIRAPSVPINVRPPPPLDDVRSSAVSVVQPATTTLGTAAVASTSHRAPAKSLWFGLVAVGVGAVAVISYVALGHAGGGAPASVTVAGGETDAPVRSSPVTPDASASPDAALEQARASSSVVDAGLDDSAATTSDARIAASPNPERRTNRHTVASSSDLPTTLDRTMISDGIATARPAITACGADHPDARGTLVMDVVVAPDGHVMDSFPNDTQLFTLAVCIESALRGADFAKTENGGKFRYTFQF